MTTSLTTRARSSATASRSATLTGLRDLAARTPAGRVAAAALAAAVLDAGFALVTYAGVAAIACGAAVWVLMANAVLPALGVAHEPIGGRYWWAFLTDHALLVGLPIALLTTRGRRR